MVGARLRTSSVVCPTSGVFFCYIIEQEIAKWLTELARSCIFDHFDIINEAFLWI